MNLLRQELAGTSIYLDILQKTTSGFDASGEQQHKSNGSQDVDTASDNKSSFIEHSNVEEKLEGIAEEKLVSFCEQILREASDLQSNVGETTNMSIHRVLELRSPIIVKVWYAISRVCFDSLVGVCNAMHSFLALKTLKKLLILWRSCTLSYFEILSLVSYSHVSILFTFMSLSEQTLHLT